MRLIQVTLVLCWLTASTCQAFYNPEQGRWLSRDPIGENDDHNIRAFLRNAPVSMVDSDGRQLFPGMCTTCGQVALPGHECGPSLPVRPPANNPCDGYKRFIPTPPCLCNCKRIPDNYPAKAEAVCNRFMEKYRWSDSAQCVARCLTAVELGMKSVPHCSVRAFTRLLAHTTCYAGCGFYPWRGLPPGGVDVGYGELIKTLATCRDPWNRAPFKLHPERPGDDP